jgi:drug/metabolite transporter (DMT)-like permease
MNTMKRLAGIILIAISAASFGTLGIFARFAYADGLDALTMMALRFSLAALVLLALLAARREPLPRGRSLLQLIGMGAIGYVGQTSAYFSALKYASPGLVGLLLYTYPAFVTIQSALWLREPVTRLKVVALGLALTGLVLTVGPAGGQLSGVLLAILAAAIYSLYIIVGAQVMRQVSAIQSSTVIFFSAGLTSSLLMAANGAHLPLTGAGWAMMALMVLIATVLPVVTFLAGLQRIGATNAAMLSTLEPVVTVLLSALLLGESLKPVTLLGGGLILTAVLLLTRGELHRTALGRASEES